MLRVSNVALFGVSFSTETVKGFKCCTFCCCCCCCCFLSFSTETVKGLKCCTFVVVVVVVVRFRQKQLKVSNVALFFFCGRFRQKQLKVSNVALFFFGGGGGGGVGGGGSFSCDIVAVEGLTPSLPQPVKFPG